MEVTDILSALCGEAELNGITDAEKKAKELLSPFAEVSEVYGGILGIINPEGEKTLLLDAHIDEIGFTVTEITDSGFLKVAPVGGIDSRMLPAMRVRIHGKRTVDGVFCSVPPHLCKDDGDGARLEDLYIDTGLKDEAKNIIAPGDCVSFFAPLTKLLGNRVTAKSLDNRAGAAALIRAAELISRQGTDYRVLILFSRLEEINGAGQNRGLAFAPDEAISVDVSFGTQPGVEENESRPLGSGAMIGVSPILSKRMSDRLCLIAKEENIPFTLEVMGGRTGTNTDSIAASGRGVEAQLISVPLKNMHTPVEIVSTDDIESVAKLIAAYAKGGRV